MMQALFYFNATNYNMKNSQQPAFARPYSHDERPSGGYEGDRPETFGANIGLSKHELACIELRLPETGDPELDALIAKVQLRDLASSAMNGLLANAYSQKFTEEDPEIEILPIIAANYAKAILAELEKESTNQ